MMLMKKLSNLATALVLGCWLGSASACVLAQSKMESTTQPAPKQNDDAKQYSKSVSAGGAEFEVVAGRVWHRPAETYDEAGANIGLRITNRGDKELTFHLRDTLKVGLKSADGKELVQAGVPKSFLSDKPVRVAAGKSETVTLPTRLFHTRISSVCLGLNGGAGWFWLTHDIQPGKYRLSLHYENQHKDNGCWLGKVQTETVEIEVKAAKDKAAQKGAAAPYDGFKADRALLRKQLIHKAKGGGKDTKASSGEACDAAQRIFSRVAFLYRTRDEVLGLLGDPATISDYNAPAGKGPTSPLAYVFDSGHGGYKYTIRFGELLGRVRVTAVEVEGQN